MHNLSLDSELLFSTRNLLGFIKTIKSKEMRTNVTFTFNYLDDLINEKKAWINIGNNTAIILIEDTNNILRLFYYAKTLESLKEIKYLLPLHKGTVVCDIVGKDTKAFCFVKELETAGFRFYAKFQRMLCNNIKFDNTLDISEVEVANVNDANEILDITYSEFDPLTSRILSLENLREKIMNKEVFVIRKDNKIAGFTSFDSRNNKVVLLDHVIVRPEYRKLKIAKKILNYKWKECSTEVNFILWINELCKGEIIYHSKNGFKVDGMYDYILII